MPKKKGERVVDMTTSVRVNKKIQEWLKFLNEVTDKSMSEILEAMIKEKYPDIEALMAEYERTKKSINKKMGEE